MLNKEKKVKKDEFNERIRQIREHLGVTQEEFGRPLGLDWFSVRDLESGKKRVTPALIVSIEKNHSINSHWMLTGEGNMILSEDKNSVAEKKESPFNPVSGLRFRQSLPEKEEAEYQEACQTLESDDLIRKIVLTLGDMPLEKRREVLSIAKEKKLLSQLMKERAAQDRY